MISGYSYNCETKEIFLLVDNQTEVTNTPNIILDEFINLLYRIEDNAN